MKDKQSANYARYSNLFPGGEEPYQPNPEMVWRRYMRGKDYNAGIDLDETVKANENFFIGKSLPM